MLDLGHQVADEILEILGSALCGPQHLLVVRLLAAVIIHHNFVRDEGQTKDTQTAVAGHNHLWHRTHACTGRKGLF